MEKEANAMSRKEMKLENIREETWNSIRARNREREWSVHNRIS